MTLPIRYGEALHELDDRNIKSIRPRASPLTQ